jgi:DNA-binding SARP family transcriptional activator
MTGCGARQGDFVSAGVEFRVLGPLEVLRDGREVPVRAGKQRVVLAALLLRANQVVSTEDLFEHLWGERPPNGARNTLRAYVMRLRRALSAEGVTGVIETRPPGYHVHVADHSLDLRRFDDLVKQSLAAADNDDMADELRCLRQALELWRGPVLSNVDSAALHRDLVPALKERRLNVLQRRFDLELRLGGTDEVIAELQKLTATQPLRERFWAQLMLGLYRAGRQAEALGVYRRMRSLFADELGIEPGEEVRDLHQAILTSDPKLTDVRVAPATRSAAAGVSFAAPHRQLRRWHGQASS